VKIIRIYPSPSGWIFEVWIAGRVIILGSRSTRARAEFEAGLA
jgi:hypothetical protein